MSRRDGCGPGTPTWCAIDPLGRRKAVTSGFSPAAEIVKDGDDAVVRVELPGVDVEKDVNVEVDKGQLVIHGEHRDEHAEEKDGRTLREVRYGSFRRVVPAARPTSPARRSRRRMTPAC